MKNKFTLLWLFALLAQLSLNAQSFNIGIGSYPINLSGWTIGGAAANISFGVKLT